MIHQHRYSLTSAHPGKRWYEGDTSKDDVTIVLYVCERCANPKVVVLRGVWDLQELKRPCEAGAA